MMNHRESLLGDFRKREGVFVVLFFAMVSNGVDTCRQVLLCQHASQCPRLHRGRCLFQHRDADADVKPLVTRTEEEIGWRWRPLEGCQQVGVFFDVAYMAVCSSRKSWRVPHVVEESTVERIDGQPVCGTEESVLESTESRKGGPSARSLSNSQCLLVTPGFFGPESLI